MLRYSLKRLFSLGISLVVASLVIFAVIEIAPGDPAGFMLGLNAQPDTVAALRAAIASHLRGRLCAGGAVDGVVTALQVSHGPLAWLWRPAVHP